MARAALYFEGITDFDDLRRAIALAEHAGFTPLSKVDRELSGVAGASFSVSSSLAATVEAAGVDADA